MKKDSEILIKCNKAIKKEFISLCKDNDTSASREIRAFMQRYISENTQVEIKAV